MGVEPTLRDPQSRDLSVNQVAPSNCITVGFSPTAPSWLLNRKLVAVHICFQILLIVGILIELYDIIENGCPGETRTRTQQFRRLWFCPLKLQDNEMVVAVGLEPTTVAM